MMLGCSSRAEVRASRWKRSTNSLSNARENGSTLIATSRSSCFSFALNTIAMPPRPSSSRISYSSLSSCRTMSISAMSGASTRTPVGVVAVRSRPQESQNFAVSLFWVPQRELVADRQVAAQLRAHRAQPMQARLLAHIPRVAHIAEHGERELVGAERQVTQQPADQSDGHAVLRGERRGTAPVQCASDIPAHWKRPQRRTSLSESKVHAA